MLSERKQCYRHAQTGFSLVELMIAIALGLLLLGAATTMTVSSMVMNGDTLKSARLNQDLDSVLQIMVNDIRRAGYTGGVPSLFTTANEDLFIKSDNSCVLYAYDANDSGAIEDSTTGTNEWYGFRLSGSQVEMRTTCSDGTGCATDCDTDADWTPFTDSNVISITALTFGALHSKCLNIRKADSTHAHNFWETTNQGSGDLENPWKFPCMEFDPNAKNVTNKAIQDDGSYVLEDFAIPESGDRLIGARQVNIQLQGELAQDDSMTKSQFVAINVRNNLVQLVP